jgi:hypothetical protein
MPEHTVSLRKESAFVEAWVNETILVSYFMDSEITQRAKRVIHLWGNVRERLNLYDWTLRLQPSSHEGYCWHGRKILDVGLENENAEELLIHEAAHTGTDRFCNCKHTWQFWKTFVDYMYRFMPGVVISESEINHMMWGTECKQYRISSDNLQKGIYE